jgi:hypothetical protein
MLRFFTIFFVLLLFNLSSDAQELNCRVHINSSEIGVSNKQVFTTMEKAVHEFMNNTKWTNMIVRNQEKIECSLTINILENPETNTYKGNLQLQVSRPVYNSTYKTPILSYNDKDVSFNYQEYQPLEYNQNSFDSNLVSLLTYYAYTILGFHADTFAFKGGEPFFKEAENVVNMAQQGGGKGWKKIDGNYTRYMLNESILAPAFVKFREAMYLYHLQGLDRMTEDKTQSKKTIAKAIIGLEKIYDERPNTFLIRVFMDTKSEEIVDIFSDGPRIETTQLREVLNKIFPSLDPQWQNIKI